jgi:hypothetical protein
LSTQKKIYLSGVLNSYVKERGLLNSFQKKKEKKRKLFYQAAEERLQGGTE